MDALSVVHCMKKCFSGKKILKSHVFSRRACEERARLQDCDRLFRDHDQRRFSIPCKTTSYRKLVIDGITDKHELMNCWIHHFSNPSSSQLTYEESTLTQQLYAKSFDYCDGILDVPFETQSAVKELKCEKGDGLQPEHLKYGGHSIVLWLQRIFNKISVIEDLPPCLKLGIVVPVFTDPLDPNNYRGINLTSVISKCLEIVLLNRLEPLLTEKGFPHHGQQHIRKCADAIFSTQEAILQHMQDGESPTLCCFDLFFDSIRHPILFDHMFKLGINGKCWRRLSCILSLWRSWYWYSISESSIKVESNISPSFPVCCGVKKGSILSPTLFIIVTDSLLKSLNATHLGLSRLGLDIGSYAHADDIRIVCTFAYAASRLGASFCNANLVKLNKTEAVSFSAGQLPHTTLQIASDTIHSQPQIKCLGVWWQYDLSPNRSLEDNIAKACRAFFATGSIGNFHGKLNPLSSRSIFEIFVIPVLLYGCET